MIGDRAQADTGDPMALRNTLIIGERNVDQDLNN